jgi:hypothetical protein
MSETSEPDRSVLTDNLERIHRAISRGLRVSHDAAEQFAQSGLPEDMRHGYTDFIRSLISVMHAHHLGEDELAFPFLRQRMPSPAFDRLEADHLAMLPLLDQSGILVSGAPLSHETCPRLAEILFQIQNTWLAHIQREEEVLSAAKLAATLTLAEQAQLTLSLTEHGQQHAQPSQLTLPFVLFNLEAGVRQAVMAGLPPLVSQQLIPVAWREQWAPMLPFLLSETA